MIGIDCGNMRRVALVSLSSYDNEKKKYMPIVFYYYKIYVYDIEATLTNSFGQPWNLNSKEE
jgi:hypothetical protein